MKPIRSGLERAVLRAKKTAADALTRHHDEMAFRSVATFRVKSGAAERFERAYRAGGFLERAVTNPGFIRGELIRPTGEVDHYVVVAEWDTEADYLAWQGAYDQLPAEPMAAMLDTLAEAPHSTIGEIVLAADRSTQLPA